MDRARGIALPFESTEMFSRSLNGFVRKCNDHACRPNAPRMIIVTVGQSDEIGVLTSGFSKIATISEPSTAKYLNLNGIKYLIRSVNRIIMKNMCIIYFELAGFPVRSISDFSSIATRVKS